MNVLIVENDKHLGRVWSAHIRRLGGDVTLSNSEACSVDALREQQFDILILNLNLQDGSAMVVSDYASYRQPDIKVIFVTSDSFFSDGSIFRYMANACAMVPHNTTAHDLAAIVDYHAR